MRLVLKPGIFLSLAVLGCAGMCGGECGSRPGNGLEILHLRGGGYNPGVGKDTKLVKKLERKLKPLTQKERTALQWASLLPGGPQVKKVKRRLPKRRRLHALARNLTHCAVTRENPGIWVNQTRTHEPKAEETKAGILVKFGPVSRKKEKSLHIVEFVWLMAEDRKEVLGFEHITNTTKNSHLFSKEKYEGRIVVPFISCNKHGQWEGAPLQLSGTRSEPAKEEREKEERMQDEDHEHDAEANQADGADEADEGAAPADAAES